MDRIIALLFDGQLDSAREEIQIIITLFVLIVALQIFATRTKVLIRKNKNPQCKATLQSTLSW